MKSWQTPYLRRFLLGMAGYVLLLPLALLLVRGEWMQNTAVAILIMLLPALPLFYAIAASVANVRAQDELQQRIHLEAILITALLTGGLTFSYGLLESAGLVPDLPLVLVAPFMIAIWGIANVLVARRYR